MPIESVTIYWHMFLPFWQEEEGWMVQTQNENQNTILTL